MLTSRNILFSLFVMGCSCVPLAFSQSFSIEKKPPSIVVKDEAGNVVDKIPVPGNSEGIAYSKPANTVYIVHTKGKENSVIAVNLAKRQVEGEIKVGGGGFVLMMSSDGRRLFCYTGGLHANQVAPLQVARNNVKPGSQPTVTAIDTSSNTVVATYDWFNGLRTDMPKNTGYESSFVPSDDGEHLIAVFRGYSGINHTNGYELAAFSGTAPQPIFKTDPGGHPAAAIFSMDKKLLFMAVDKGAKNPGCSTLPIWKQALL